MYRRAKRLTLMPAIALAVLGGSVAIPALSSSHLYAAAPARIATVVVHPGQTVWDIAADHTANGANVQDTVDQIVAINHLDGAAIVSGEHLKIPQ